MLAMLAHPITPDVVAQILVLIVLLVISALVSGSEVAFFTLRPQEINSLKESPSGSNKIVIELMHRPKRLLATILVLNNLVNIGAVILSAFITAQLFDFSQHPTLGFIIQVVVVTFILVLVGEVIPKIYATKNHMGLARFMAIPLLISDKIFAPISWSLVKTSNFIDKRFTNKGYDVTMDELTHAIDITSDTTTPPDEKKILKGIVNLGEIDVKQIMKPRMDVFAIDISTPFDALIKAILDNGHSRIPIIDGSFDKVSGLLYIKDLMKYLEKGPEFKWQQLIRQPFYVPEIKPINDLLHEFQERKMHMAIVVDEYGGSSGIVTLEDVLEEIVGEINDEFDDDDIIYSKLDNQNFVFEGKSLLNDICRVMEIDRRVFESIDGEIDTVAGLLLELFGRIPEKNDSVQFKNFTFTIESADRRRIKRVKITAEKTAAEQEEEDEENRKNNGPGLLTILLPLLFAVLFSSCESDYSPKPRGFFRIAVPHKTYKVHETPDCPFRFEIPGYAIVERDEDPGAEPCWINVKFPQFNAEINMSYKSVNQNVNGFIEDSRSMAYRHTVKAEAINESLIHLQEHKVHGVVYQLEGNTASAIQFFATDSTRNFLRGSLYFNVAPQRDSLDPIIKYLTIDIYRLINTLEWK